MIKRRRQYVTLGYRHGKKTAMKRKPGDMARWRKRTKQGSAKTMEQIKNYGEYSGFPVFGGKMK